MTDLPRRMTETMDVLSSIPRALSPLGQVADLAGGFFGSRGLGAFGAAGRPASSASRPTETPVVVEAAVVEEGNLPPARPRWSRTAPSAQDTFRRSAAKHPVAKEPAPAKRATAKKATKRSTAKAPAKKAATKKAPAPRSTARKAAPRTTRRDDAAADRGEEGRAEEGDRLAIGPVSPSSLSAPRRPVAGRRAIRRASCGGSGRPGARPRSRTRCRRR